MEAFDFFEDVYRGLTAPVKYIESKYFYDDAGDKLFQQIMNSPEYYLTNCELEILSGQSAAMASRITSLTGPFDVVELGAGDALKSKIFLKELLRQKESFTYFPIDISPHVIESLKKDLPAELPELNIYGLNGEYFSMLEEANRISRKNKIVLFLGSNIGNFTIEQAQAFCCELFDRLQPGDWLLTGFDLKKNPKIILDAYNDKAGITKQFNLNLLHRINRELDADFNVDCFDHYAVYDPVTGSCRSYLVSLREQVVCIGEADFVYFEKNEPIYVEISQKYSPDQIKEMAIRSGFRLIKNFFDTKKWFVDSLWRREL